MKSPRQRRKEYKKINVDLDKERKKRGADHGYKKGGMGMAGPIKKKKPTGLKRGGPGTPGTRRVPRKAERDAARAAREKSAAPKTKIIHDIVTTKTPTETSKRRVYKGDAEKYTPRKKKR